MAPSNLFRALFVAIMMLAAAVTSTFVLGMAPPQLPKPATGQTIQEEPAPDIATQLDALSAKLFAGDVEGALAEIRAVINRPDFEEADADLRYRCYLVIGVLEGQLGSPELGLTYLTNAGEIGPQFREGAYWQAYTQVAAAAEDYPGAVRAATTIAADYPDLLKSWNERFVLRLLRESRGAADPAANRTFLEVMWRSGYEPTSGYTSLESFWLDLIDIYLADGSEHDAGRIAIKLENAASIAALSFDATFAKFAPTDPAESYRDAIAAHLVEGRKLVSEHPREARAVGVLASTLTDVDHLIEALAVVDEAIARVDAAEGKPAFDDEAMYLEWVHTARTRILMKLGRWDEAVASQIRSRDISHSFSPGAVSQSINLGDLYYLLGEPDKALEAIADMDIEQANAYGVSAAKEVEACAYHQKGEAAKAAEAVDVLVAQVQDNFPAAKLALLCVGDLDRLAEIVVGRLEEDLQSYMPLPENTEIGQEMDRLYDSLAQREDVVKAVDATGRILKWPVFRPGT